MSKRLQVRLKDKEYREIQRAARSRKISVSEWVRQALSLVRRNEPSSSVETKLGAIRAAVRYEFPIADIDQMLTEIERGYGMDTNS
jgi:Ribbon-helix-helix protein, copG family